MGESVRDRVIAIIAEQAVLDVSDVSMDATLEDLGIDSLGLVESIFAIEEAFDIQVPFNANEPRRQRLRHLLGRRHRRAVEGLVAEQTRHEARRHHRGRARSTRSATRAAEPARPCARGAAASARSSCATWSGCPSGSAGRSTATTPRRISTASRSRSTTASPSSRCSPPSEAIDAVRADLRGRARRPRPASSSAPRAAA